MLEVKPFSAIRYDLARMGGDVSAVIAPPYDVLGQADKDALLKKSDRNIVAIDLPFVPPKSAGPAEVYQRSADLLSQWLRDGTMIREEHPALYVYHQVFEYAGQAYTRRMFIVRVRLVPFSHGSVLPHELTFGGPKEDRLALMQATTCQVSSILGLYSDAEGAVGKAFAATVSGEPNQTGRLAEVDNRMWIVTDAGVIDSVVSTMADKRIYIADGHHRYSTALIYREWLKESSGGSLPDDHPANYISFVLARMDDPGCLILPYCRVVAGVAVATLREAWSAGTESARAGDVDVVLHDGATGEEWPLRFTNRRILASLEPSESEAWRQLDYAYLHRYLLDKMLTEAIGRAPDVRYVKSVEDAKQVARREDGVALLMNATPMAHLRAVSEAGGLMPQKSTYFHPKLATGLTLYPLS